MKPVRPKVNIVGDSKEKIMAQTGWIVGYGKKHGFLHHDNLVVWCFGFLPGTIQAKVYGVSVEKQTWVMATTKGNVITTAQGKEKELPKAFKNILVDY